MNEQIDQIQIHTETLVKGFFNDYRWLSNYHECTVIYKGLNFNSSEAAYQSAKTNDEFTKTKISSMTPRESKKFGNEVRKISGWDSVKTDVMREVLLDKFTRNEDLKTKLLETGSKYLEETNYWSDTFWGVYNGRGKNTLGILLMEIRDKIKNDI